MGCSTCGACRACCAAAWPASASATRRRACLHGAWPDKDGQVVMACRACAGLCVCVCLYGGKRGARGSVLCTCTCGCSVGVHVAAASCLQRLCVGAGCAGVFYGKDAYTHTHTHTHTHTQAHTHTHTHARTHTHTHVVPTAAAATATAATCHPAALRLLLRVWCWRVGFAHAYLNYRHTASLDDALWQRWVYVCDMNDTTLALGLGCGRAPCLDS
jgi:hypothetical protein